MFRRLPKLFSHARRTIRKDVRKFLDIEQLEDRCVPSAVRTLSGFTANALPANDDRSTCTGSA
jgi:hypothetical protein